MWNYFKNTFNNTELTIVKDRFNPNNTDQYYLLKDLVEDNWVWVRTSDYKITYWQLWSASDTTAYVIYFPNGIVENDQVNYYDFKNIMCSK